jgi:hypothetical protein
MHTKLRRKTCTQIPITRPTSKCEDNIKINLMKPGCESVDWIQLDRNGDH